jgi:hypothetical protein
MPETTRPTAIKAADAAPRRHCWGATKGLMNANEIVVHEVDRHRVLVVRGFLTECIGQPVNRRLPICPG